ncbi:glucokinase [Acuticoccus sediminis]|uniref:Glucokinase n=1 Tax=Acuticoccus sediminis TaxID=2184697 RepID=A0A8B2P0Y7_9HYPH|nr:glucokinase [Acuticoccus sediminis]RAI03816.1 glucokinase [Acuticoccus sediminis]
MQLISTSHRALIGDIGGTNARFAASDLTGRNLTDRLTLPTQEFGSMTDLLAAYTSRTGVRAEVACLAVAGPITHGAAKLTNAAWSFSETDVCRATGVVGARLVNDFEALAYGVPHLGEHDLATVKPGTANPKAPVVVLGPGTGFGAASLVPTGKGWISLPGEGGHMTFGTTADEEESVVHDHFASIYEHVSVERILSGSGIEAIDGCFGGPGRSAEEIVEEAARGDGGTASRTIDFFARVLARIAGDIALVVGARGGVYLGGGIAPRILDALDSDAFRTAFVRKGRMSGYLADIPVRVITIDDGGLRGAAVLAAELVPDADRVGWAHT